LTELHGSLSVEGMNRKWIVVANRAEARVFVPNGKGRPFQLVHRMDHPEGRLKGKDFYADSEGISYDSFGTGRHKMERDTDPTVVENKRFAAEICQYLQQNCSGRGGDSVYICAGPRFTGYMKEKLNGSSGGMNIIWIQKNLKGIPDTEIHEHLKEELPF